MGRQRGFCCSQGLKTVQPVKELHDPFQRVALGGLHNFAKRHSGFHYTRVNLELFLEREGVVDLEPDGTSETSRDTILTKVVAKGAPNIGKHEASVFGQGLGKDGGQGGQCVVYAGGATRNGAIGEDENGSDGVDMVLDLSFNTSRLVEPILLSGASVD